MDETKIRALIEEIDPQGKIPDDVIEQLIVAIKDRETNPLKDGDKIGDMIFHTLSEKMIDEDDWRRRASISAQIISHNFDY